MNYDEQLNNSNPRFKEEDYLYEAKIETQAAPSSNFTEKFRMKLQNFKIGQQREISHIPTQPSIPDAVAMSPK